MNQLINAETKLLDLPALVSVDKYGVRLVKNGTVQCYKRACKSFLEYVGENVSLCQITPSQVQLWHEWLKDQKITVRTANSYRRTFKAVLRKCGREDLAQPISQLREPPRKAKAITDRDLETILSYASLRDAAMIMFMRDSGVRRGTIPLIKQSKVKIWESSSGDYRVAVKLLSKNDTTVIALAGHQCAQAMLLWLDVRPYQSDYIFTTESGQPLSVNTINSIFRKLKERARLPKETNIFPHALRHRFAHKMLSQFDAKLVSQWLGHATVTTTLEIYGERSEEELMDAYFSRTQTTV